MHQGCMPRCVSLTREDAARFRFPLFPLFRRAARSWPGMQLEVWASDAARSGSKGSRAPLELPLESAGRHSGRQSCQTMRSAFVALTGAW